MPYQVLPAVDSDVPKSHHPPGAGRTRTPTEFDDAVQECYGKGWQQIPTDSNDDATYVKKQLWKAARHFGLGIYRKVDESTNTVFFRVQDKQKSGPKMGNKNKGDESVSSTDPSEDDSTSTSTSDQDAEDLAEAEAKDTKRLGRRKKATAA